MDRNTGQQAPESDQDLRGFPQRTVRAGTPWHRVHRDSLGPWFFASQGYGRFDLRHPHGTCYLGNTAEVAAREAIGPDLVHAGVITDAFLAERVVSRIPLPTEVRAAKLTSNEALAHRVSGELSTMPGYGVPQAWAEALRAHGFEGIWYRPRFSPGKGRALGVFGPAGEGECGLLERQSLRAVVDQMVDVRVVRTTSLSDYEILDEP